MSNNTPIAGATADPLGITTRMVTVLFSNLRNFSPISVQLGPVETMKLLNEYFSLMMESIEREGGELDKFMGDQMMVVFGAPTAHEDTADRAVRAALSMAQSLSSWNEKRKAESKRTLIMHVGMNTDIVAAGNVEAPTRMAYTVVGEGVNLASQLSIAAKERVAGILISEGTHRGLKAPKGTYKFRDVEPVRLRTRRDAVKVYELMK